MACVYSICLNYFFVFCVCIYVFAMYFLVSFGFRTTIIFLKSLRCIIMMYFRQLYTVVASLIYSYCMILIAN